MEIKDLRESLTSEQIVEILHKYGVEPSHENKLYLQYPTCCHNIDGGSPKLYYYKDNHMFKCYTHCDSLFDIFELIMKMEQLRGNECSLPQAIRIAGLDSDNTHLPEDKVDDLDSLEYLSKMNKIVVPRMTYSKGIDEEFLQNYISEKRYLKPWTNEGITVEVLNKFGILYDIHNLAIVIPHRDVNGNILGIRGRFMSELAPAKYMPLSFAGTMMAHPLRGNLYGLYENKNVIQKSKTVIIFESEKSVLKFSSFFGHENNFSVATCGNKISNEQIQLLQDIGVKHVILAFDKDYHNSAERAEIQKNYEKIGSRLSVYFNTSIILDFGEILGYKDSPIDRGRAVFEELFKYRYYI